MPFVAISAFLLLLTIGTMQYTKKSFGFCVSANVFGIVLVAYIFALINHLSLIALFVRCLLVVDAGALAYHLVQWIRKKCSWNIPILQSAFFVVFIGFLWFIVRGRMYSDWDEFSFWGSSLKFVMYEDVLYTSDLFDNIFKTYPPAQILLQYSIMKTLGIAFREDVAILISSVPLACAAMYPVDFFIQKKKYAIAAAGAMLLMLSPAILETTAYTKTTVDLKLGVMVSLLILIAMLPERKTTKIVLLSMAGSVLTLYKTSGFALALLTLLLCGICLIWREKDSLAALPRPKKLPAVMANFLPIPAALAFQVSWQCHVAAHGLIEKWNSQASLYDVWKIVTGQADGYRLVVLQNFANQFFSSLSQGRYVKFPTVAWMFICLLAVAVAVLLADKKIRPAILCSGLSCIGVFVLFSASLLYSYLFVFSESEATELASFYRYLNTGILPLIMVSFSALLWACLESGKAVRKVAVCLACLCLILNSPGIWGFWNILKAPGVAAAQTHHDRYLYIRTARYIRQLGGNPRVYLITAYDAGWTQMLVSYELQPEIVLPEQYTMISATPKEDPSVYTMSAEEWSRLLFEEYDYVYIHCPETQFVADYISVFEDESQVVVDRMFKVIRHPDGTATLRRIEMKPEDGYVS